MSGAWNRSTTRGTTARGCRIATLPRRWHARPLVYLITSAARAADHDPGDDERRSAGRTAARIAVRRACRRSSTRKRASRPPGRSRPRSEHPAEARAASALRAANLGRLQPSATSGNASRERRARRRSRCSARRPASAHPTDETIAPARWWHMKTADTVGAERQQVDRCRRMRAGWRGTSPRAAARHEPGHRCADERATNEPDVSASVITSRANGTLPADASPSGQRHLAGVALGLVPRC